MASIPAAGLASAEVRLGDPVSSTDEENFPPCVFQGAVLGGSHSLSPLTGCVFLLNVEKNRPTGEGGWLHGLRGLLRQASLSTNNIFTFLLS